MGKKKLSLKESDLLNLVKLALVLEVACRIVLDPDAAEAATIGRKRREAMKRRAENR